MRPSSRGLGAVPRKPSKLEPLFLDRPESAKPVTLELELQAKVRFYSGSCFYSSNFC